MNGSRNILLDTSNSALWTQEDLTPKSIPLGPMKFQNYVEPEIEGVKYFSVSKFVFESILYAKLKVCVICDCGWCLSVCVYIYVYIDIYIYIFM